MRYLFCTVLITLTISLLNAGSKELKISKSIPRVADFKEALDESRKKSKPIVVIYADESTNDEGIIYATKTLIKKLKPSSALVYANKDDYAQLPDEVKKAFNVKPQKGFPKTVILYPNLFDIVAVLPAVTEKDKVEKLVKAAKERIKEASEKMRKDAAEAKAKRDKADAKLRERFGGGY